MNRYFVVNFWDVLSLTIPSYSLFTCIGLLCMMLFLYFRIEQVKMSFKDFLFLMLLIAIGVGIGSKFVFILTKIPDIIANFSLKYLLHTVITSGFVFYGGLFGAITGVWCFCKLKRVNFTELGNIVAPAFPMFHIFGRIGCFFAGCCYGKEASWGFALEAEPNVLRIPIQLIEACILIIITALLLILEKSNKYKSNLLETYLFLYAGNRFWLEFFRGDSIRGIWLNLSTSQWISILIVLVLIVKLLKKKNVS